MDDFQRELNELKGFIADLKADRSATKEKVTEAFKILCADKNVRGVLVNIFGGIMKCDVIANGILTAVKQVNVRVPLVVRLEGTNVELGKKILKESGLAIIPADSMADAAQKIVHASKTL